MRKWLMGCFPYEMKDYIHNMRNRYSHVSFTGLNLQTFEDNAQIELIEACKMVGICGTISDLQNFVDKDYPNRTNKNPKR